MFNPKRLVLARNARRMTQEELSNEIGYHDSMISRWENGANKPPYEAITKIAQALSMPERWFSLKTINDEGIYQFRSLKKTEASARDKARAKLLYFKEITQIFEEWVDYPSLNIVESPNRIQALNITDEKIEQIAEAQRELWQLGNRPIKNLTRMLENSGVLVTGDWLDSTDMDGVSTWIDNRPYILLARDKGNYFRNRFDSAHEYAHSILHKNLTSEDCEKIGNREIERQANYFAGCLLMPNDAFSLNYKSVTLNSLVIEKRHWGVSVAALIMRYYQLGLIDEAHKTRLFRNYSYRKWRYGEPYDDVYKPEKPELLYNTVNILMEEGGFRKEDIIDRTLYSADDLEQLCYLPKGMLSNTISTKPKLRLIS